MSPMNIYDDLRKRYEKWRTDRDNTYGNALRFSQEYRQEFQRYIGAPPHFYKDAANRDDKQTYVRLVRVEPLNEDQKYEVSEPLDFNDHLTAEDNNGYVFGIMTYLEVAQNTYPKQPFWDRIAFIPDGNELNINIHGTRFKIYLDDKSSWTPLFDHMVQRLKDQFSQRPNEAFRRRSDGIGFLPQVE